MIDRFMEKVVADPGGCWIWTAARNSEGYGRFRDGARNRHAHIVAYEMFVGPVPADLELDHLCRVRCCVNPEHLEPVTHAENMRRSPLAVVHSANHPNALRTRCKRGHSLDDAYVRSTGRRACRTCVRAAQAASRAKEQADY